jgi:polygalacturonase
VGVSDQTTQKRIAEFVQAHGKPGTAVRAVVEPIGRAGARIVLVGADGAMGDVMTKDVESATKAVEAADNVEQSEWDRETTAATKIGSAHRRKMAKMRS